MKVLGHKNAGNNIFGAFEHYFSSGGWEFEQPEIIVKVQMPRGWLGGAVILKF